MLNYRKGTTQKRLKFLLVYDPADGQFRWRLPRSGQPRPGSVAGCLAPDGYIKLRVDGVTYQAHRLAWLYMTGDWPKYEIDHADLNRSNNKWGNLRAATHQQNMINVGTKRRKLKYDGHLKCVYPTKNGNWISHIVLNGKAKHLGTFSTKEEAYQAYLLSVVALHGEFARAA